MARSVEDRRSPPRLPPPSSLFALLNSDESTASRSPLPTSSPRLHTAQSAVHSTQDHSGSGSTAPQQAPRSSPQLHNPPIQSAALRPRQHPPYPADQRNSSTFQSHHQSRSNHTAGSHPIEDYAFEKNDLPDPSMSRPTGLPWPEPTWRAGDMLDREHPPYGHSGDRRLPYHSIVESSSGPLSPPRSGSAPHIRSTSATSNESQASAKHYDVSPHQRLNWNLAGGQGRLDSSASQKAGFPAPSPPLGRQVWPTSLPQQRSASFSTHHQDPRFSGKALNPTDVDGPADSHAYVMRKRLRISRACDECRRRKTKCDVVGAFPGEATYPKGYKLHHEGTNEKDNDESGANSEDMVIIQSCTNCRRSMMECTYTKQRTLKRNTNKSYYKDLERRLDSLETHVGSSANALDLDAESEGNAETRISRLESALLAQEERGALTQREQDPQGKGERASAALMLAGLASRMSPASLSPPTPSGGMLLTQSSMSYATASGSAPTFGAAESQKEDAEVAISRFLTTSLASSFGMRTDAQEMSYEPGKRLLLDAVRMVNEPLPTPVSLGKSSNSADSFDLTLTGRSARLTSIVGVATSGSIRTQAAAEIVAFSGTKGASADHLRYVTRKATEVEADTLAICYLEALRHGHMPSSSLLAAMTSKLSFVPISAADPASLRRHNVAFVLSHWHAVAFASTVEPHLPAATGGFAADIEAIGMDDSDGVEVVRAAHAFAQVLRAVTDLRGWSHVTELHIDAILDSLYNNADPSSHGYSSKVITDSSRDKIPALDSVEAMWWSLRSSVKLYHAIQKAPHSRDLYLKDVLAVLSRIHAVAHVGDRSDLELTLKSRLLRTPIAVHVLAIAASAAAWASRAITFLASVDGRASEVWRFGPSISATPTAASSTRNQEGDHQRREVPSLNSACRESEDYLFYCSKLCEAIGGEPDEPGSFKGLALHLAAFSLTEAQRVRQPDSRASSSTSAAKESTAGRETSETLAAQTDDFLDLITRELGPLGVVLVSTSDREAWALHRRPSLSEQRL